MAAFVRRNRHVDRAFRIDEFARRRIHELLLGGRSHKSEGEISRAKRACAFGFSLFHMSVWRNLGAPLQQGVRSHFIFLQLFLQEFHSRTDSFAEVTKNFRKNKEKTTMTLTLITGAIALFIGASFGFSVGYEWGREDERMVRAKEARK